MARPEKLWNANYIIFIALQSLNFALLYFTFPIIPQYAVSIGYDLSQAGLLAGGFAIASLISRPITGYCIDHFDRKKILILALAVCGFSTAALALTEAFWVLMALRLIYGSAFAFSSTTFLSCGTDCIPENNTAEGVGYFGLGIALAAAVGPPVGLALNNLVGAKTLFFIMGGISLLTIVILLFVPVEDKRVDSPEKSGHPGIGSFIEAKVIFFAVLVIPFAFSNGFINSFITMTAEERHISGIGVFFTVFAIAMMALKPLSGKMQDRFGLSSVLFPAFICTSLAAGIISVAQTLVLMIISAVLLAFGQGAGQPSLQSATISKVDRSRQGVAIGTYYVGLDIGNGIGNITGGKVADALGYTHAYRLCAVILIAGLAVYSLYIIRQRGKDNEGKI